MSWRTPEYLHGLSSGDLPPAEPQILYDHNGALAVQIPKEIDLTAYLRTDEKVASALTACGMSPELAVSLLVQAPTKPVIAIEDQFSEHIRVRAADPVRVLDIDFFPAAAKAPAISSVFVKDAEIILGTFGLGILEIVPVTTNGEQYSIAGISVLVAICEQTLVILPPKVQGNRWDFFAPSDGETPSLTAIYVAYPGPFETAEEAPLS